MDQVFVRVLSSKKPELKGKKFFAVVVKYANGTREKLLFQDHTTICSLLNVSPLTLYDLDYGDYAIV